MSEIFIYRSSPWNFKHDVHCSQCVVKMLRHSVISDWEWVGFDYFFSPWFQLKSRRCAVLLQQTQSPRWLWWSLACTGQEVTAEKWDRVLGQLWVADHEIRQHIHLLQIKTVKITAYINCICRMETVVCLITVNSLACWWPHRSQTTLYSGDMELR